MSEWLARSIKVSCSSRLVASIAALGALLSGSEAIACQCSIDGRTVADAYRDAADVVLAEALGFDDGRAFGETTFEVVEAFVNDGLPKGGRLVIRHETNIAACGVKYRLNEPYVLYLNGLGTDYLCSKSRHAESGFDYMAEQPSGRLELVRLSKVEHLEELRRLRRLNDSGASARLSASQQITIDSPMNDVTRGDKGREAESGGDGWGCATSGQTPARFVTLLVVFLAFNRRR